MHFSSLEALKEQLIKNFNDLRTDPHKLEFGYIGPGHGSHGKQNWITADEDVHNMYEQVWYVQLPKLATFRKFEMLPNVCLRHAQDAVRNM